MGKGQKSVVGIARRNLFESVECPKFIISDIRCNGRETTLEKCAYKVKYADCTKIGRAAGAVCNEPTASKILYNVDWVNDI